MWLYRPGSDQGPEGAHKTAHRGHKRIVPLGPRAQEVLRPWLRLNVGQYLFQPREAEAARDAERTRNRKTKQTPSQARRRPKRKPKRAPGEHYTVWSYGRAIARACDRAFPPPAPLARREDETIAGWKTRLTDADKAALRQWRKEHRWHPHQLRHTKATEIRREAGLDAARAVLGHRSPAITEVYAEIDIGKAAEIMERLG